MLKMELPGNRKRGRNTRRRMDAAREDMAVAKVTEQTSEHMNEWRWTIRCVDDT